MESEIQKVRTVENYAGRPIFVISCMRSGSTLFRYLLNTHERLVCPPETRFLVPLKDFLSNPEFTQALNANRCKPVDVQSGVRHFINAFMALHTKRAGKPRWIDKSPNYYRILPFLDELFQEDILYLFLVRHPLDSVCSLQEFFTYSSKYSFDPEVARIVNNFGNDKYGCAKYWVDVYERIAVFMGSVPNRSRVVKYEDLVRSPSGVMSEVISFLGEDPALLHLQNAFDNKTNLVGGPQDHKILGTDRVHTKSIDRWKRLPIIEARAIWDLGKLTALRFGYPLI
jgi:protein-tyrosine sulfotransferase